MVSTNDPQEAPNVFLWLFTWFFIWWALLGPLSRWPISELVFYLVQERVLLTISDFMALAEPRTRKDILKLRLIYWACILIFFLPNYNGRMI